MSQTEQLEPCKGSCWKSLSDKVLFVSCWKRWLLKLVGNLVLNSNKATVLLSLSDLQQTCMRGCRYIYTCIHYTVRLSLLFLKFCLIFYSEFLSFPLLFPHHLLTILSIFSSLHCTALTLDQTLHGHMINASLKVGSAELERAMWTSGTEE